MKKLISFLLFALNLISVPVSSIAQVDVSTGGPVTTYANLKLAFDAINTGTHTGAILIEITGSGTYTNPSAPAILNSSGAGSASYISVLIRPSADGVAIFSTTTAGRGVIELNGADNVTIDGDNPNTSGTNRNLTVQNLATSTTNHAMAIRIAVATSIITSANNNVVRNCLVIGHASGRNISTATSNASSENTSYGIYVGGGASAVSQTNAPSAITSVVTTAGAGATWNDLTFHNNSVTSCARGIAVQGSSTSVCNNLTVTNNVVGSATSGNTTTVYSMGITLQGFAAALISDNYIRNIESFLPNNITALDVGSISPSGNGVVIQKNKIEKVFNQNITTYGAYGINYAGGLTAMIVNNWIVDVKNNQNAGTLIFGAAATYGAFGIRIVGTAQHKIYQNTVHLFGAIGGTFGANLVASFHTQTGCDVRNNIFSNQMMGGNPAGTRLVNVWLPSGGTPSMNLTINNNAYYGGTHANSRLAQVGTVFGTGEYTTANFNPQSPTPSTNFRAYTNTLSFSGTNDNVSFAATIIPPFISNTDLHITNCANTKLESGGASSIGVTTDIDGNVRPGPIGSVCGAGFSNDIGCVEFDGSPLDSTSPAISYFLLSNTSSVTNRELEHVIITDPNGVSSLPGTRPRVYYKRSIDANTFVNNTSGSNGWKYSEATGASSPFDFTIDYSLLNGGSGVTVNDTVQYFVVAQDTISPPNVGINSGVFAYTPSSVNLSASVFPIGGTTNSYKILGPPLAGNYTIGVAMFNRVTGKNISFKKTIKKIQVETIEPISVNEKVTDHESRSTGSVNAPGVKVLKEVEEVSFVPVENEAEYKGSLCMMRDELPDMTSDAGAGVYATISAAVTDLNQRGSSAAVKFILLDETYYSETLPIDINYQTDSETNTLTIQPSAGVTPEISGSIGSTAVFRIASSYVTIDGSNNGSSSRDLSIMNTSTATPTVILFHSTGSYQIRNSSLKNCIITNGVNFSTAVVVSSVFIGNSGYFKNISIQNNDIRRAYNGVFCNAVDSAGNGTGLVLSSNILTASGTNAIRFAGLYAEGVDGALISSNEIANFSGIESETDRGIWLAEGTRNTIVERNLIHHINYTGVSGYGGQGIAVSSALTACNNVIKNNMIHSLSGDGWNHSDFAANNPIGISIFGSAQSGIGVYYNSIYLTGNTLNQSGALSMGIYLGASSMADLRNNSIQNDLGLLSVTGLGSAGVYAAGSNSQFSNINNNNYYVNPTGSGVKNIGRISSTGSNTLASWQTATGQDANSVSGNPRYLSAIDLHIDPNIFSVLESSGTQIAGITDDYDGNTRNITNTDIGADEFNVNVTLTLKSRLEAILLNRRDTLTVNLRSSTTPYPVIETQKVFFDSLLGISNATFINAKNGVSYYLEVIHRNSLTTWSAVPVTCSENSMTYDFTTGISQAFGSNQTLVNNGTVAAFYTGEIVRDQCVDISDVIAVFNDAVLSVSGNYILTDLNYDKFVDLSDVIYVYNNSSLFVCEIAPPPEPDSNPLTR